MNGCENPSVLARISGFILRILNLLSTESTSEVMKLRKKLKTNLQREKPSERSDRSPIAHVILNSRFLRPSNLIVMIEIGKNFFRED